MFAAGFSASTEIPRPFIHAANDIFLALESRFAIGYCSSNRFVAEFAPNTILLDFGTAKSMTRKFNFVRYAHWLALLLLPFLLLPAAVNAEEKAEVDQIRITPFLGYRAGGEFEDAITATTLDLDEAQSYGLIFSKGAEDAMEFSISVQPTKLNASNDVSSADLFDIDVMNFMVIGKNILNRESGTFVSGMVGVTHFDPHESGLSSETRFALGVGGGIDYPIANNLSFRLEGRGIGTFLDSSGGIFCSSSRGCAMYADSSLLLQFEVISGLTFRF